MFMNQFFSRSLSDRLAELVHQARAAFPIGTLRPKTNAPILQRAEAPQAQAMEVNPSMDQGIETLDPNDPDICFIKLVEDALRKFPDFILLGASPLAGYLGVQGETQIARGKQPQRLLQEAIEALRPDGRRPAEPLPRAWYNYVVLYDAYVEGVLNREVMARLYISEGAFNRTHRNAVRGVARLLIENSCGIR